MTAHISKEELMEIEMDKEREEVQRQVESERKRRKFEKEKRRQELSFEKHRLREEEKRLLELQEEQKFIETEFEISSIKKSSELEYMAGNEKEILKDSRFKQKVIDLPGHESHLNAASLECDDEAERVLTEKIQRLKMKEQTLASRIDKIQTEKERKLKKESALKDEKMKKLKEERMKKLKEKEKALIESLMKKESLLTQLEMSDEEEKLEDKEVRRPIEDKAVSKMKLSLKKPTIPKLTEETFEEWKIEVEVILNSGLYHDDIIRQEVRNSLSGKTRKILLNIDSKATTKELITKLENIYGNIRTGESVVAEFYTSKQKENETVAEWGVRVESILNTAIKKGQVKRSQADEMLRNRFWRHLRSEQLKNATRVFFESSKDFEELRKKVRIEENEMEPHRDTDINVDKAATSQQRSDSNEQLTLMKSLLERMEKLEEKIAKQKPEECQDSNELRSNWRGDNRRGRYYGQGRWNRNRYRGNGRGYGGRYNPNYKQDYKESDDQEAKKNENKHKDKPLNM